MSIGIKGAGITLSGIAAYIILSKAINVGERVISKLSESSKWKNYYKYGNRYSTPPGYYVNTYRDPETDQNVEVESPEKYRDDNAKTKSEAFNSSELKKTVESIAKAILKSKGIDLDVNKKEPEEETTEENEDSEDIPETPQEVKDNITELFSDNKDLDGKDEE